MAKVTWLGEDTRTGAGPSFNVWNGKKFPKGKAVEVTDPHMLAKARANQFYRVTEDKPKQEAQHAETPETQTPVEQTEPEPQDETEEAYNFREAEKGSGYSPAKATPKKRVRKSRAKPKPAAGHAHRG